MSKKIIALIVGATVIFSLTGCFQKEKTESIENTGISATERNAEYYNELQGSWVKDYTLDGLKSEYNKLLSSVEDKTKSYGLKYSKDEKVREENGVTINENFMYLDNENPEPNRLESLYFGIKIFGEDLATGQITLRASLNFDGESAIEKNDFDFGSTSIASYSQLLTGVENRDYSDINSKILDIIKSESGEGVISSSVDGLYEEFTVTKEYIVYKIETKIYEFQKSDEANQ